MRGDRACVCVSSVLQEADEKGVAQRARTRTAPGPAAALGPWMNRLAGLRALRDVTFDMHLGSFVELHYVHGAHGFFDIADLVKIFANNKWDRCLEDESVWIIHTVNVTTGLIVNRMAKHVQKKWKIKRHHRLTNWMIRLGIILANKSNAMCATSNPRESHEVGNPFHLNLMD